MTKFGVFIKKHRDILSLLGCFALYGVLAYVFQIPCPIKAATGISCPGCGMSRALIAMLTFDFETALYYHPLVFLVIPVVAALIVFYERRMEKARNVLIGICVALLIAVYVCRMFIVESPVLEFMPENSAVVRFWSWVISLFG